MCNLFSCLNYANSETWIFFTFPPVERGADMERHWILLESDPRNNFAYGPKNWSLMEIWRKPNVQPFFLLKTTPTAKPGCFLHCSLAQHGAIRELLGSN